MFLDVLVGWLPRPVLCFGGLGVRGSSVAPNQQNKSVRHQVAPQLNPEVNTNQIDAHPPPKNRPTPGQSPNHKPSETESRKPVPIQTSAQWKTGDVVTLDILARSHSELKYWRSWCVKAVYSNRCVFGSLGFEQPFAHNKAGPKERMGSHGTYRPGTGTLLSWNCTPCQCSRRLIAACKCPQFSHARVG